jgi:GntR family transcriptional regulator/MocR family aminotransferase
MKRAPDGLGPIIALDRRGAAPLYAQVYAGYRNAILDGRLRPGQRLPSTRSLARDLGISRIPVVTAFQQLVSEGYVRGRIGAGTFVSPAFAADAERAPRHDATGTAAPGRRRIPMGRQPPETEPWLEHWGAFRVGQPALELFPAEIWARLVARCARRLPRRQMSYGDPMGFVALREAIADVLRTLRSVRCTADQIMIVNGSQQALSIAARVLLAPGDAVWIEEPGFGGARDALTLAGARPIRVPVDADGLDVATGIARSPRARAAYVTPSHQYPLGVIMSAPRRLDLLAWARRRGAWLIEDDYDSEHHYDHQPIASLHGLDTDQRVVYVGTFSKQLFPAVRIGYLVMPPDLTPWFRRIRQTMDNFPTPLYQRALNEFIREGHFIRHLRRMRGVYAERRRVLVSAIERQLGDRVRIIGDHAGMHVVITLPPEIGDRDVAVRAAARGISVIPLSSCYAGPRPASGLLLGYGATPASQISHALTELRRAIGV